MSNSQNKKNEQQNNLCTTNLTEQWKKGKLERGRYYIKYRGNYMSDNWHGDCWEDSWSEYVEEVLAPVPSYDEWKELKDEVEIYHNNFKLMKVELERELENQQLKKLLLECKEVLLTYSNINGDYELYDKIINAIGEKK